MDVIEFLRAKGLLDADAEASAKPLTGGYWNAVSRVRADGVDWVCKVFAEEPPLTMFPILPDDEARALQELRGLRVAPEFVAYFPAAADHAPVLVYEWVEGAQWEHGTAQVAEVFRRQHAVEVAGFREVPIESEGMLAYGDRMAASVDTEEATALLALRPTRAVGPCAHRVLLHTDAGTGNFIVGDDGPRLIDWQCPALGDAAEDLFTFLSPAFQVLYDHEPLTPAERAEFLDAYGDADVLARLDALWPALTYRMGAYCVMRQVDLAESDPTGSARYARAVSLSLADLEAAR